MKRDIELEATVVEKYAAVSPVLDELSRRRWAAAESLAIGYGGDALVSAATGLARETIRKGRREIARGEEPTGRIRRPGAGRPRIQQDQPGIQAALEALVDPLTRGDPTSPLRWTCKSRAKLAAALTEQGWRVSSTTVGRLLHRLGYRLQSPRKRQEGATHPDRNAQFEHINQTADKHLSAGQPVISVDTKKKELVGNFKNGGREWQPKGTPPAVLVHDFPTDAEGKAIPYGVYDMARNEAFVSVGWDHDTPTFAVASIRHWWQQMGCGAYPEATTLFITADAGGSNGYRSRAWKHELQQLADETGLTIEVSHFPPGTSKWNKIEHRLFCHITANWRGTPLTTYETIVDRIGNVRTATGLQVRAELERRGISHGRQGDQGTDGGTRAGSRCVSRGMELQTATPMKLKTLYRSLSLAVFGTDTRRARRQCWCSFMNRTSCALAIRNALRFCASPPAGPPGPGAPATVNEQSVPPRRSSNISPLSRR